MKSERKQMTETISFHGDVFYGQDGEILRNGSELFLQRRWNCHRPQYRFDVDEGFSRPTRWPEMTRWQEPTPALSECITTGGYQMPVNSRVQWIIQDQCRPRILLLQTLFFYCTQIIDEGEDANYGFYWTGTTHQTSQNQNSDIYAYIYFGEALGWMLTLDLLYWV